MASLSYVSHDRELQLTSRTHGADINTQLPEDECMCRSLGVSVVLLILIMPPAASADSPETIPLPVIDGQFDEAEWAGSKIFSDFHIVVPKTDEKFYDSTLVYVRQSHGALYFAFRFYPRSKVIRQSLIRDVSSNEENEFFILLDLENRNENGYIFIFNFMGNQRDMAIYNQRTLSYEWDWVWQSRSNVIRDADDSGPGHIDTEVRIPVAKIQNKNPRQIGFDLQMFAYKPDGSSYFYAMTPESEILTLKGTHKLDIEPFDENLTPDVSAIPYVLTRTEAQRPTTGHAGGDLNFSLDRHKLKATYNTDESTLEADPFQFALNRQSIFLIEKRPFFSKDLDIYRTPIDLFYTRGVQQITWGANYTFRSNDVKSGVVLVEDETDGPEAPEKHRRAVARATVQTGDARIGTTLLYGTNVTTRSTERVINVDAVANLPLDLRFTPQWATNTSGTAFQLQLARPRNWAGGWSALAQYRKFGRGFDVSTLFTEFGREYDQLYIESAYRKVSNRPLFSQLEFTASYSRARTLDGTFMHQNSPALDISYLLTENMFVTHRFESNRPDDFHFGTLVNRNNFLQYHSVRFILGPQAITFGYTFGPYFGTHLYNPSVNALIILWDRLAWDLTLNHRSFGGIQQTIVRAKVDVRLIDHLYFRSFIQRDSYTRQGLWNSLLQYEFFAGSNVYLVLNQEGERFERSGKTFKVGYEIDL
jgi:hypothetical protein